MANKHPSRHNPDDHNIDDHSIDDPSPVPSTWYERAFGDEYLKIYKGRDSAQAEQDVRFAIEVLGLTHGRTLDLCCGAGRHLEPLRAHGLDVIGLDRSAQLLERARSVGPRPLVLGDMRHLPFSCKFDAVLNFFTSFGYFFDESENLGVLREIARVLRPDGVFLLDLMDRTSVAEGLVPRSERQQGELAIQERRWLSPDGKRVEKEMIVAEGQDQRRYYESVRLYEQEEARGALASAGLEVTSVHGDFSGSAYRSGTTPRMILTGRKCR